MNILVFNSGSSSLGYSVFATRDSPSLALVCRGKAHRVGVTGTEPSHIEHSLPQPHRQTIPIADHSAAASLVLDHLIDQSLLIGMIGHRFVHGGALFQHSTLLTPEVEADLVDCLPLAPIHNPNAYRVILACRERLPDLPQYVTFDTAFHAGMSEGSAAYAIPPDLARRNGFRKYGFHGLSYRYVVDEAAGILNRPLSALRLIACHLGTGGSSVAAIHSGRTLDTSMGYSPLAGLVMSTRTGDLDPVLVPHLLSKMGGAPQEWLALFNQRSGLLGLSGFSSDLRDIIQRMDDDPDDAASLAFEVYTYRVKRAIGAYAALMGGLDALIFTDDIGVQNPRVREAVCKHMEWCGLTLDADANASAPMDRATRISSEHSPIPILSIPNNEELVIAREGAALAQEAGYADL